MKLRTTRAMDATLFIRVASVVASMALGSLLSAALFACPAPVARMPGSTRLPPGRSSPHRPAAIDSAGPQMAKLIASIAKARKRFTRLDTPASHLAEILSLPLEKQAEEMNELIIEMLINHEHPSEQQPLGQEVQLEFERAIESGRTNLPMNTGCYTLTTKDACCRSIDSRYSVHGPPYVQGGSLCVPARIKFKSGNTCESAYFVNRHQALSDKVSCGDDDDKNSSDISLPADTGVPPFYQHSERGAGPRIIGLETCQAFRASVPQNKRQLGIAGMQNSGTNLLTKLLALNCRTEGLAEAPVLWGKHNPAEWRPNENAADEVLPVVMVKDPLTWMHSMCRRNYQVRGDWLKPELCPMLIDPEGMHSNVVMQYDFSKPVTNQRSDGNRTYRSLLHMWSSWNDAYFQYKTPRIMIRYEDILFNQEQTLREICTCVGGSIGSKVVTVAGSSKDDHGSGGNREQSMQRYNNATERITKCLRAGKVLEQTPLTICEPADLSTEELDSINNDPDSRRLMDLFGYKTNYKAFT